MKEMILLIFFVLSLTGCKGPENNSIDTDTDTQTECTYNSDCQDGYHCEDSICVLDECTYQSDCQDGYSCEDSICVLDEDPTPPIDCTYSVATSPIYYVATDGSDESGDGSVSAPFATIAYALDNISDGGTVLVKPGLYEGRVRLRGTFTQGVTVRSQEPYLAQLRYDGTVITAYTHPNGVKGITLEGFDIAHSGAGSGALVVHLDGDGTGAVSGITLRNNILHDSYNNDVLKINNGISQVTVERNIFYNQSGSDELIDINSAANILVQDNIFMNDFSGSGRTNNNDTSSYIVIKDSNGEDDRYTGSHNIILRRNIFLNWEGSSGSNFVLLGEDGQDFYEAYDITIENNLMLGNSSNVMRAPFGIKGAQSVTFNNNTIVGNLPAMAFAMRINREGDNPVNDDISMYNNIWSDPTGTMGAEAAGGENDFSDTPTADVDSFVLSNNLYWNGGSAIPQDSDEAVNVTDDGNAVIGNPILATQTSLAPPHWNSSTHLFYGGFNTICEVFEHLAEIYGTPAAGSAAIGRADAEHVPQDDLFGNPRDSWPDIGAVEVQ